MLWTKVKVRALVAAGTLILTGGGGTVAWKLAAVDVPAASAGAAFES